MASDAGNRLPTDDLGVLLEQVAGGDEHAYGVLYDSVSGMVYAIVRRVVQDPAQSEEVTQDVMLELWRLAARFDPGRGSARGWIATMAHRRAIDLVRSSESSRQRNEAYGRATVSGGDFDVVLEEVVERYEHESVRVVLGELTPLQRESIELAYFDGLTYREVAIQLDAPIGTLKTRIRDGMVRLRNALGVDDD
ncbi:MAG: ECF RNA polymerase sigma factor SigK [Candidatus Limnocylindria bacterium]